VSAFQPLLEQFSTALQEKFSSTVPGEPEDQLRAPFEALMKEAGVAMGHEVVAVGETRLANNGGRPDFGVSVDRLLCGYAELKAPGKGADTAKFTGHDARQWKRFSDLPNILYSDGHEFALYRYGEMLRSLRLEGSPQALGAKAVSAANAQDFRALLHDFFAWEPVVPSSSAQLAEYLAPLTRILRDDVLDALETGAEGVVAAAQDWRRYLFPGANDKRFADAYAQTITFALLLARSDGSDTLVLDEAVNQLTHSNSLLSRALRVLTDPLVKEHLATSLSLLQRVINAVPAGTMSGGRRDPWLHFYEDFLSVYDPQLRKDAGAYYTPVEVVQAQVRMVDDLLRTRLGKRSGFASGGVDVLDPAVGTGTYLLGIVEYAMQRVQEQEGPGAVAGRASLLAKSLYGFEIMVGPYAVAALRMTRMLQQFGAEMPADGAQIILNNTLESPHDAIPELPLLYRPIGIEHQRARRVKNAVPILVCIGNPPYDRHAAATPDNRSMTGGWVRWGDSKDGKDAILNDFIDPVKEAGHGGDLKNLYNLYVYFWRWALWKTFEHDLATGPGIVTYISASSFIDGKAFLGLRRHMRRLCDEIWIIDLGGEGRGTRRDENVFDIQTPVAITVAMRSGSARPDVPAKVHYTRVEGGRAGKLELLEQLESLADLEFEECPDDWDAPFRPAGEGAYFDWPLLTDLMPWQQSGVKAGRTWVIATDQDTLKRRYGFLTAAKVREERALLFKNSPTGKKVDSSAARVTPPAANQVSIMDLDSTMPCPAFLTFPYRSLDRQFIIADGRFIDRSSPPLWHTNSAEQIYFAGLFTQPLGAGPGLTVCADVPDLHYFRGSYGARDIFPLWRDAEATQPNLHPGLLPLLSKALGQPVSAEDAAAYLYAVLAHPAFTERFHDQLATRELRVPLTTCAGLFSRAVELGRELLFLHTYGERFAKGQSWPDPVVKCLKAVPAGELPDDFAYDSGRSIIEVGGGEFGPVSAAVWEYEVSGLKVVQSWLGYRMKNRKGRKSSPLDDIVPAGWGSDYTSELLRLLNLLTRTLELAPLQAKLLDEIQSRPLIPASSLGPVKKEWRQAPKRSGTASLI